MKQATIIGKNVFILYSSFLYGSTYYHFIRNKKILVQKYIIMIFWFFLLIAMEERAKIK